MRNPGLLLLFALFSMGAASNLMAQDVAPGITKFISEIDQPAGFSPLLDPTEFLLRMGQQIDTTDLDCSHFVQWLFERAGLYYGYAPSRILYAGMAGFKRVHHPEAGDLIVWPGHVGIVVDPEEETFLSALRSGVKTASYTSRYWKRRGRPRFFRYLGGKSNPETVGRPTNAPVTPSQAQSKPAVLITEWSRSSGLRSDLPEISASAAEVLDLITITARQQPRP